MANAPPINAGNSHAATTISPSFSVVDATIRQFAFDDFSRPWKVDEYCELFGLRHVGRRLSVDQLPKSPSDLDLAVAPFEEKPFAPDYADLCRLHWLALSRKSISVLEFGSGFSTVVLADALRILSQHFGPWAKASVRCDDPFHVFAVEEEQRFVEISTARLGPSLASFATVTHSSVEVITHDNRIATVYSKLPNICPDLIYLDGPSQYASSYELNGFSFCNRARMPMSADLLRSEFFLEPGTLVIVDGRTSNARFLMSYLRRNWAYHHDVEADIHLFELQEAPLGPLNRRKLEFCLNGQWLIR